MMKTAILVGGGDLWTIIPGLVPCRTPADQDLAPQGLGRSGHPSHSWGKGGFVRLRRFSSTLFSEQEVLKEN